MRGSVIIYYNQIPENTGTAFYKVLINNEIRDLNYSEARKLYSTYVYEGDVITIELTNSVLENIKNFDITKKLYTTDNENNDNGIKDIYVTGVTLYDTGFASITVTATTSPSTYNFEYIIDLDNRETFFLLTELSEITMTENSDNIEQQYQDT